MNLILLLVLITEGCIGLCVWLSPECLRWLAAHLLTRADVIDIVSKEKPCRMQFWNRELGTVERSPEPGDALPQSRAFARH